jgi:hypothetical protein
MWYRMLSALLAALAVAAGAAADDRDAIRSTYQGKIQLVDLDKRTLVLGDAFLYRGGSKGKVADRTKERGSARKLTFELERDARVTLDGHKAQLKDLKAGQYARVRVVSGRARLDRGGSTVLTVDRKDTSPSVLKADRVEASTRMFPAEKRE